MTKSRVVYILGILLVFAGAIVHSHAESWALYTVQTSASSPGTIESIDYPMKHFFEDTGLAMMSLGVITFTVGLIAWLYPPHTAKTALV